MKIIYVSDHQDDLQADLKTFFGQLDCLSVQTTKNTDLYSITSEIKEKLSGEKENIIFIDLFLECADGGLEWLQKQAGIALLKFLRMHGIYDHIVLLSPYTEMQLIKAKPGNLIVSSKGVSVSPHLHEYHKCSLKELQQIALIRCNEDMKPYILADFHLPEDERHNWANWWGIYRLWEVHRYFDENYTDFISKYEGKAFAKYIEANANEVHKKLITLDGQKAIYLYGLNDDDLKNAIVNEDLQKLIIEKEVVETQIKHINIRIKNLNGEAKYNNEQLLNQQVNHVHKLDEEISAKWRMLKEKLYEDLIIDTEISQLRQKIRDIAPNLKILYIDDKAKEGWSTIFQKLFYDDTSKVTTFITLDTINRDTNLLFNEIESIIKSLDPDIILLDLRLQNENGSDQNTQRLSGAMLLDEIRKCYGGLPVMITTASNKAWSFEALLKLGADCFWSKEGIDSLIGLTQIEQINMALRSYERLLDLTLKLIGEEHILLKWFITEIQKLKAKKVHWWIEQKRFKKGNGKLLVQNVDVIYKILDDTVLIMKDSIQANVFIRNRLSFNNSWFYPSLIIQNLGKICEQLHIGNINHIVRKETFKNREDHCGLNLYDIRNNASHITLVTCINNSDSEKYVRNIVAYLNNRDYCNI